MQVAKSTIDLVTQPRLWWLLLLLITAIRLMYLPYHPLPLFFDEAQYWDWSRNLDWGYYSKPPMVAWLIASTTAFCGDTEACIRLSSPLLHLITSIVIYGIAVELTRNDQTAALAAITFITLPAVSLSSAIASTDPALLCFWAISLYTFIKALKTNYLAWWFCAGIAAGLGLLSKYTMIVFLLGVVATLAIMPDYRKHFKTRGFWIACLVAFFIFLPNVIWNALSGFVSVLHTKDNLNPEDTGFSLIEPLEFLGSQFGVFGPILFAALLYVIFTRYPYRFENGRTLICFVLPLLVITLFVSFTSRAHPNWAAPMYIAATILVAHWMVGEQRWKLAFASLALHVILAGVFMNFDRVVDATGMTLSGKTTNLVEGQLRDPFKRLRGWPKLGHLVVSYQQELPSSAIITVSRKTHAELLYYTGLNATQIIKWNSDGNINDHYDLTTDITLARAKQFLIVSEYGAMDFEGRFESFHSLGKLKIRVHNDYSRKYNLYLAKGFLGYAN